jgi:radical SAM superfamily enzyme YgiQ (UPF0313 family)
VDNNDNIIWWGCSADKVRRFIAEIKSIAPQAKIITGGSQVITTEMPFIAHFYPDMADYWVCGQGEASIIALANHIKYGDNIVTHLMEGLTVLLEKDYPYDGFSGSRIEWPEHAFVKHGETLPMEVARGCVFKCAFCTYALIGKKWGDMARNADVMRADMIRNYERYGTTRYIMTDDTINDSIEKVKFLHEVFTSLPFKIEWMSYARLDLFWKYPEMAQLLMDAGMRGAVFGIETLHDEAGKKVGKGLGSERVKKTLEHVKSVWGSTVHISGLFILGLPGEPVESMQQTLDYLNRPDCPIDAPNTTALQISSERAVSKMEKDQEKYGLTRIDERKWTRFEDWVTDLTDAISMRRMSSKFLNERKAGRTLYRTRTSFLLFTHYSIAHPDFVNNFPGESAAAKIDALQHDALIDYFERASAWRPTTDFLPSDVRKSPVIKGLQ